MIFNYLQAEGLFYKCKKKNFQEEKLEMINQPIDHNLQNWEFNKSIK